jgi:hypothetical protein
MLFTNPTAFLILCVSSALVASALPTPTEADVIGSRQLTKQALLERLQSTKTQPIKRLASKRATHVYECPSVDVAGGDVHGTAIGYSDDEFTC